MCLIDPRKPSKKEIQWKFGYKFVERVDSKLFQSVIFNKEYKKGVWYGPDSPYDHPYYVYSPSKRSLAKLRRKLKLYNNEFMEYAIVKVAVKDIVQVDKMCGDDEDPLQFTCRRIKIVSVVK